MEYVRARYIVPLLLLHSQETFQPMKYPAGNQMELGATTAENRLWRAVLQQAYEDAEQPQMADGVDPETRARAQRYLRADAGAEIDQLKLVCYFAEVPFDRVVSFARKRYTYVPAEEIPTVRRGRPRAQCASRGVSVERSARHYAPAAIVQTQEVEQVS